MLKLPPLSVAQTDLLAGKVLAQLAAGMPHPAAGHTMSRSPEEIAEAGVWDEFHNVRARLTETVHIPMTSLTPLMARVLFGLGVLLRPRRVVVLGSYAGNLMAWLTAPGFGPHRRYEGEGALGLDVDAEAVALARRNFAAAGFAPSARHEIGDAFDVGSGANLRPDMLLIDIDDPHVRKAGYQRLLARWLPVMEPGGVVLAHDVCHPVFDHDLAGYRDFVRGAAFSTSHTLPVDECGLEVSVIATAPEPAAEQRRPEGNP